MFILMDIENFTPIYQCSAPMSTSHRPKESYKPILAPAYELWPCLIEMVQNHPFLVKEDKNPYLHLWDFKQTYDCLHIVGMLDEVIRWKLFPLSLRGRARIWYDRTIESKQGDWGSLRSNFYLDFFPIHKVINLRAEVITFKQKIMNLWP
jgi:hypothetical protein